MLEGPAIPRLFMNRVQSSAAELGGEEAAKADLDFDVGGHAAELRSALAGALFGLGKLRGGEAGEIFEPLRDFDWAVLATALALEQFGSEVVHARKELRIERADVAEYLWSGCISIRRRLLRIDDGLVGVKLGAVGVIGR